MLTVDSKLGCQSPLVLAKLGFDLRDLLTDTVSAPLPPRLAALCDELAGYAPWRDVDERCAPE